MRRDEIVAVGMGTVNALGVGVETFWDKLIGGEKEASPIRTFDASGYRTQCAHQVPESFDPLAHMSRKTARRQPRPLHYLVAAMSEAIGQAFGDQGIPQEIQPLRRGIYVGACISQVPVIEEAAREFYREGRVTNPTLGPKCILSYYSGQLALLFSLQGATGAFDTACASSADAIRLAWMELVMGGVDLMFAAGVDLISEILLATFDRAGALSRRNDDPGCKPFDRYRDGFLPGDGAAVIALMRRSQAEKMGITPLAVVSGWAASNDAYSWVAPNPEGTIATKTIAQALARAGISPKDVDYINAHGTGTVLNDPAETKAIKATFGDYVNGVVVGSTKGATGHLMGGAGALEVLICIQSILKDMIPPTVGLKQRDLKGGCDLDYVRVATEAEVKVALSNSFGFGGHNSSIVLTKA